MSGVKFDGDKVDMTILPPSFLVGTARALSYGAGKYDRWNFLKVKDGGRRYSGALLRHIVAWMAGEDRDPESGLHHLECASANLAMLISSEAHGVNIGDWREPVAVTTQETPVDPRVNDSDFAGSGACPGPSPTRARRVGLLF